MANGHIYDPSAGDKRKLLKKVQEHWNSAPMTRVSLLKMTFRFKILKSHGKKYVPGELCMNRIDLDNLCKLLMDSLNGVVWQDDRFIGRIMAEKVYSEEDSVTIEIYN